MKDDDDDPPDPRRGDNSHGGNSGPGGSGGPGGGHGDAEAHIEVDGHRKVVRRGDWVVEALKRQVGVDPAKVLAEITPSGLKDLDDNATIKVRDEMRFMSHARKGGSS